MTLKLSINVFQITGGEYLGKSVLNPKIRVICVYNPFVLTPIEGAKGGVYYQEVCRFVRLPVGDSGSGHEIPDSAE